MKEYAGYAANCFLVPADQELIPRVELVLLVAEPSYEAEPGGIGRRRGLSELRLSIGPKGLRELAKELVSLADDADRQAARFGPAQQLEAA